MKKLIIGIFIGAALASAVFYFLYRKDENEHRENVKNLLELMQQKQKNEELTQSTINDPGSLVMTRTALSILISPGNEYYYFHGSDCSKIQKAGADKLQTLLLDEKARTNTKDLMILIKEIPGTPIKSAMDLLDMISMAKIPPGHFTSVDVSEKKKPVYNFIRKIKMNHKNIHTLGELKKSGYVSRPVKEEIRENLVKRIKAKENPFPGILGYEDSVIPDTERALLSRHNILFLGLRGQAKTRMARQMVDLLDEYIPVVAGSEINDDPLNPISRYATDLVSQMGDETPVTWLHRSKRYAEKLATPDVSVADLIGDIDPIKAANLKLDFADERVLHFGIIPRSNRCIFVINELPDLQARIQVSLFNILEEGDLQIRGFKLRLPLDVMFVFTANPKDYTNRGSIVTPLKDRIESQILTHYPKTIETALSITAQEASIIESQHQRVRVSDFIKRLIEQVAFEARENELVDKKSGVSARLTISAYENAVSAAERRAIINDEKSTQVWLSDLTGIIPSITGKIELVYEGEQEGPFQVAYNLLERAIRSQFIQYFPNPEKSNKRKGKETEAENPYKAISKWFDAGHSLNIFLDTRDEDKKQLLYQVSGLHALVKKYYNQANEDETALLMEFVLHGLASYSLISKKIVEGKVEFKDLMGSMLNMGNQHFTEDDFNESDYN